MAAAEVDAGSAILNLHYYYVVCVGAS
jgi:hypothetical protein